MRLTVDVYDAYGNKKGIVPHVLNASISRVLDGAGTITINAIATDERALDLLQNEARVRIYVEEKRRKREIGRGIVRSRITAVIVASYSLVLSGPDSLDELKRTNTLFNRSFSASTVKNIIDELVGLAGWSADVDTDVEADIIDERFDGVSILKALQGLVERRGYHFRLGNMPGVIQFGYFGQSTGLRLINPGAMIIEAYDNPDIGLIDNIVISEDSEAIANRLFVLGGGQNVDAALTLEQAAGTIRFPVKSKVGPDGRTVYYIEDEESILKWGVIERVIEFKEIVPLTNDNTAIQTAADLLYDAALTELHRMSQPVTSYTVGVRKVEQTVRPGDKIHMSYRGMVDKDGGPFTFKRIEDDFWVTKVTESIGVEGKRINLKISTIDQPEDSVPRKVVKALEKIDIQGNKIQPAFGRSSYGPYIEIIDSTHSVEVPFIIGDASLRMVRCLLRIKSRPLREVSSSFVISDDTQYPAEIAITVNGLPAASGLGSTSTGIDEEIDITDILASGDLRQTHSISITCTGGRGAVEVQFEVFEHILPQNI